MTERAMQTLFRDYLTNNPPIESENYELKICKNTSMEFSRVKDHQIKALLDAEEDYLFYRIADQPWGYNPKFRFTPQKPFDCLVQRKVKGYIVIWFFKPRKQKVFIKIPIKKFAEMKDTCGRKSMTEEMAIEVGEELVIK